MLKNLVATRIFLYYHNVLNLAEVIFSRKITESRESPPSVYPPPTPPSVSPLPREPFLFCSYGALCSVCEIFLEIWTFSMG